MHKYVACQLCTFKFDLFKGRNLLEKGYPSWAVGLATVFAGGIITFCIILFTHIASSNHKCD